MDILALSEHWIQISTEEEWYEFVSEDEYKTEYVPLEFPILVQPIEIGENQYLYSIVEADLGVSTFGNMEVDIAFKADF